MAAIRKGLCSQQEAANCLDEYGEAGLEWACANCPKKKFSTLHPYTLKLLNLAALQKGGFPLAADDLSLEEWVDLGRLKETLQPNMSCPLMGSK
jgi:hypothetical protein